MLVIYLKKPDYNTKISETEKKITNHDHHKYIAILECNNFSEDFAARLAQASLASKNDIAGLVEKTDFDNKLFSFNKQINSNKTKHEIK